MNPETIPDKLYFKIGEVAEILKIEAHVLRFWESEFNQIKPTKSKALQRLYKRDDLLTLLKIKELLYTKKYTIEGARLLLKEEKANAKTEKKQNPIQLGLELSQKPIDSVRAQMADIIADMESYLKIKTF